MIAVCAEKGTELENRVATGGRDHGESSHQVAPTAHSIARAAGGSSGGGGTLATKPRSAI